MFEARVAIGAAAPLSRDEALRILRANEAELRRRGVLRAALFGSVARGDAATGSDVDVGLELRPDVDLFAYAGVCAFVEALFPVRTDVADMASLKAGLAERVRRDAIYAF
jgi:predicted nucleotidyltransferase